MVAEIEFELRETGADDERLEQLALRLRQEITSLDVLSVESRRDGQPPSGTRGIDAAAIGALVVSLTPALDAVGSLVTTIVHWLRGGDGKRTVRLKIGTDELELTGVNSQTQQRLAEDWIRAHALE